jgi:signal transduction histidine kinase
MLSAADLQQVHLNGRSNVNSTSARRSKEIPSAWRFIVLPSRSQVQASQAGAMILRCDASHASAKAPQLVWSTDTGVLPAIPEFTQPSRSTGTADGTSVSSPPVSARSIKVDEKYRALLAEAAHDIRAPLGVAQQIISRIASRVRTDGTLDSNEMRLLESAKDRLKQAASWCDGILTPSRLDQSQIPSIRQRFYPHQLMALVSPIVNSLAERHDVRLHWIGWDTSLPRLYLDSNQLARVLMNLISNAIEASSPGDQLSVRVAWQTNVTQRLVIAIEDQGHGLDESLLKFVNRQRAAVPAEAGIGLATVKSLVSTLGGSLSAQVNPSGGTLVRVTLPVDNRLSLVRGWLVQKAERIARGEVSVRGRIQLHVLRSAGVDTSLADHLLQQSATADDFVYRIADDRWLWLSVVHTSGNGASRSRSAKGAVERLSEQLTERMAVESGRLNCQLAFEWEDIDLHSLHNSLHHRNLLPQLATAIADKFAELIGHRIPPISELNGELIGQWKLNSDLDSTAAQRSATRTLNSATVRMDSPDSSPLAVKRHSDTGQGMARSSSLTGSFLNAEPSQFAELARNWRTQHAELAQPME